jgi:uroporphyrinogen-III synthase
LWVTRAQPGAAATAAGLAVRGLEPVLAPLLIVRPVVGEIDLSDATALAFTSANAARAFAEREARRDLQVFAVGGATAAAARSAGFRNVRVAHGGVTDLARLILAERPGGPGTLVHVGARDLAGDLVGTLVQSGAPARRAIVYETAPLDPPGDFLAGLETLDGVLLHSPRASRRLGDVLASRGATPLRAFCLSLQVADALGKTPVGQVLVARRPDEDSLLTLAADALR